MLDSSLWGPPPTKLDILKVHLKNLWRKTGIVIINNRKLSRVMLWSAGTAENNPGVVYEQYGLKAAMVDVQDNGHTLKIFVYPEEEKEDD